MVSDDLTSRVMVLPVRVLSLDSDLHATAQTKDKLEGRLLLDTVVREGKAILELHASEDEALLVGWDALLILDRVFDIVDGV